MKGFLLQLYDTAKFFIWTIMCTLMGAWGVKNDPSSMRLTTTELSQVVMFLLVLLATMVVIVEAVLYYRQKRTVPEAQ